MQKLVKIMLDNDILKNLRKKKIPDDCVECEHSEMCHGGLKCLTYAMYKDLNHKDYGCNYQDDLIKNVMKMLEISI